MCGTKPSQLGQCGNYANKIGLGCQLKSTALPTDKSSIIGANLITDISAARSIVINDRGVNKC